MRPMHLRVAHQNPCVGGSTWAHSHPPPSLGPARTASTSKTAAAPEQQQRRAAATTRPVNGEPARTRRCSRRRMSRPPGAGPQAIASCRQASQSCRGLDICILFTQPVEPTPLNPPPPRPAPIPLSAQPPQSHTPEQPTTMQATVATRPRVQAGLRAASRATQQPRIVRMASGAARAPLGRHRPPQSCCPGNRLTWTMGLGPSDRSGAGGQLGAQPRAGGDAQVQRAVCQAVRAGLPTPDRATRHFTRSPPGPVPRPRPCSVPRSPARAPGAAGATSTDTLHACPQGPR
jgi:hypothetical protein